MNLFFWQGWSRRKKITVVALCALAVAVPDIIWLAVLN
jgi:hypothetical protein